MRKNRRKFLLMVTASLVALGVIVVPVLAEELFGVIIKVDVDSKKLTVLEKDSDKEVEVTTTDDTEFVTPKGNSSKIDLGKVAKNIEKAKEKGKKGIPVIVTHEKGVASKVAMPKKKEAPKTDN